MTLSGSTIELIMRDALLKENIKFHEQVCIYHKPSDPYPKYTLDFVLLIDDIKICLEVDGEKYHKDSKAQDAYRDMYILSKGFNDVIRFNGNVIKNNIDSCIKEIRRVMQLHRTANEKKKLRNQGLQIHQSFDELKIYEIIQIIKIIIQKHKLKRDRNFRAFLNKEQFKKLLSNDLKKYITSIDDYEVYSTYLTALNSKSKLLHLYFSAYGYPFLIVLDFSYNPNFFIEECNPEVLSNEKLIKIIINFFHNHQSYINNIKNYRLKSYVLFRAYESSFKTDIIKKETILKHKESKKKAKIEVPVEVSTEKKEIINTDASIFIYQKKNTAKIRISKPKFVKVTEFHFDDNNSIPIILECIIKAFDYIDNEKTIKIYTSNHSILDIFKEKRYLIWKSNDYYINENHKITNIPLWEKIILLNEKYNIIILFLNVNSLHEKCKDNYNQLKFF